MFCYGAEGWVAPPSPVSLTIRRKAQERLSGRTNVDLMKPMDKSPPPHAAAARNKIFDVHMGAPEELGGVSWRVKEEDAGPAFWAGLIRGRGMPRALHHCVTPGSKSSNGRRRREHQVLGGVRGSMRVGQRSAQLCPQRLGAILLRGRRWLPGRKKSSVRHSSQHCCALGKRELQTSRRWRIDPKTLRDATEQDRTATRISSLCHSAASVSAALTSPKKSGTTGLDSRWGSD